jgi:hypothetical protein
MEPETVSPTPLERRQKNELKKQSRKESKLPTITIILMLCTTALLDVGQLFLDTVWIGVILNPILDWTVIPLGFYIWFKMRGVNMASARKSAVFLGGALINGFEENLIPLWTVEIALVIAFQRGEEFLLAKSELITAGAQVAQKFGKMKGNQAIADTAKQVEQFTKQVQKDQGVNIDSLSRLNLENAPIPKKA